MKLLVVVFIALFFNDGIAAKSVDPDLFKPEITLLHPIGLKSSAIENHESFQLENSLQTKIMEIFQNQKLGVIIANMSDYTDKILANIRNYIINEGHDPEELTDIDAKLQILLTLGELKMTNGWISGLSGISRNGDVILSYDQQKGILTTTVPLTLKDLTISYDYLVKILLLGPSGGVQGKVSNVQFSISLSFNLKKYVMKLESMRIQNKGHVVISFTGNILVDWLVNLLTNTITTLFNGIIMTILNINVKGKINDVIADLNKILAELNRQ